MCFGGSDRPLQPPPPPPKPPPPEETAVAAKAPKKRTNAVKKRRGTTQFTIKRPTMGGSYTGSGVNLPT